MLKGITELKLPGVDGKIPGFLYTMRLFTLKPLFYFFP